MKKHIKIRGVQDFYDEVISRITDETLRSCVQASSLVYALSQVLTERQVLILNLRLRDWGVQKIADELGISKATVSLERRKTRIAAGKILRGESNG